MRARLMPLAVAGLSIAAVIAVSVWSVPFAVTARSLYLFERETPTEVVNGSARQGIGLLGLDLVTLDDGRVVEVHRQGEPRVQLPRPAFLVGEHGARYADEPSHSGAWHPFALRALVAWALILVAIVGAAPWLRRQLPASVRHLEFVIFGQRDPDARPGSSVAGAGGHGSGGGQVPPIVPYNPDWDPDDRIK
jgi:hypothetical protein